MFFWTYPAISKYGRNWQKTRDCNVNMLIILIFINPLDTIVPSFCRMSNWLQFYKQELVKLSKMMEIFQDFLLTTFFQTFSLLGQLNERPIDYSFSLSGKFFTEGAAMRQCLTFLCVKKCRRAI